MSETTSRKVMNYLLGDRPVEPWTCELVDGDCYILTHNDGDARMLMTGRAYADLCAFFNQQVTNERQAECKL
jgi:hypothetical protein